jgi:hypothetical protein
MPSKISEKDVLQLFTSLKNAESTYPQGMIESRRDTFAKQAATAAILMKAGGNGAASTGAGQMVSSTTATSSATGLGTSISTILETALIITIVVEAGVAAYAYRNKIADFFNSIFSPKVEQVTNPLDNTPSGFIAGDETPTKLIEATPTLTASITETPTPPSFINPITPVENNGDSQVASTPAPTDDNNGLHLGQTKQPTKKPNNNDNSNDKDKDKKK